MYFTVLCDPHPLPLSLTGRGEISAAERIRLPLSRSGRGGWGVRADRRQTVKYLRTLSTT